ncbi:hypothetical protein LEM8419_01467 [Neolewinella maritima]|uniref:CCDC81-like prokaryotic HU domain-containing protein n=1 Tax=Neolewinella maritima TaxID=1383882 RepID=A0ABM9AZN7_9BACT|nr:hypothetical protein [Neolewinella maritima]CAH1000314.1 hypothetical protein LEM8419_01467 [Neolewinella maritima]
MSQSTIEAALRTLLMEDGRVCLPGIGTLVVEAQPALVSLMEGTASPPSKYVTFNANLVTDDGRLRNELGPTADLDAYLRRLLATLTDDQSVTLPGIGKLYQQQNEVRFTPGAGNLSKTSYGLPSVPVRAIVRNERAAAAGTSTGSTKRSRKADSTEVATGASSVRVATQWPWYLAGMVGVLLAIFLVFRLAGTIGVLLEDQEASTTAPSPGPRTIDPPAPSPQQLPPVPAREVKPAPPPRLNQPTTGTASSPSVPAPSTPSVATTSPPRSSTGTAATDNVAVIAIGLFGRQRNVRKQTGRLEAAGYTPYTEAEGRNTRVGLTVRYGTDAELQRVLADVRDRYTPDAFVMRVNGAERRPQ